VRSTSGVEIAEAGPDGAAPWSAFLDASPGAEVGHRWAFHDLLGSLFGHDVFRLVARRDGRTVGVLPLVHQRSLVGRFLTSVPYLNYAGVLAEDGAARAALAEEACALAERLRADRLELRGRDGSDLPLPTWDGKCGYALELPGSAEDLSRDLGAKVRSQIKRPSKEGFRARVAAEDGRRSFYPLLARRWHRLGSPVLPESFFQGLERAFPEEMEYVLVEREGEAAAAAVLLHAGRRVEIPWAASRTEHDRAGVNMLLYWTAAERAIERGAATFDFGRSTPGTGNARFKTQWGAVETPLRWNVRTTGDRGHGSERGNPRRDMVASTWKLLPAFLANRLGPILAARIPY
jgi:FemAB-related protein (PEP-CTERM system-associated)